MKIIISPTKQMHRQQDSFYAKTRPEFLSDTQQLLTNLKKLTLDDAKQLWKCSDHLAVENYQRLQDADLTKQNNPAIMSYKGIQFQYMAPDLLTQPSLDYLQENVRILSGFYGILRPFDAIISYRLDMQSPLKIGKAHNLYEFWGNRLYESLFSNDNVVVNLASKEYSKAITPYVNKNKQWIDIFFYHQIDDKLKVKATLAKMARGEMVRFLAENQVETIDEIKKFDHPHYKFSQQKSSSKQLIFIYQ